MCMQDDARTEAQGRSDYVCASHGDRRNLCHRGCSYVPRTPEQRCSSGCVGWCRCIGSGCGYIFTLSGEQRICIRSTCTEHPQRGVKYPPKRCTLQRTRVTEGAEQQYRGEKTYTTYVCGNELPCTLEHHEIGLITWSNNAKPTRKHDAVVTLGNACQTCGGCEWVCAEGAAEEELKARRIAFDTINEQRYIISDILASAVALDDKPHLLFSSIRRAAEAMQEGQMRDEIVRLCDVMYERAHILLAYTRSAT